MSAPLGYEALCRLAETLARPLHSVMVLSPGADPFHCGTAVHKRDAEWFAALWREHMDRGGHLRRLHYRLVSQAAPILLPSGEPYRNTINCWTTLKMAGKWARYLGLVDADDVDDRRSPPPRLALDEAGAAPASARVERAELWISRVHEPFMPELPRLALVPPAVPQRYHVEVWVEKSDVEDVVLPLAYRYGFNYVPFAGQPGIQPCRKLVDRAERSGRPVRILYISDFDPQGQSMPLAVARKIEFILAERGLDLDIELRPLALTKQQCVDLELPRIPIKDGDRGKRAFEERHGDGATELDALEALHPGLLEDLIVAEVERYHDHTLEERLREAEASVTADLMAINETVHPRNEDELEELRAELDSICEPLREVNRQLAAWRQKVEAIHEAIRQELEDAAPDLEDPSLWPEPAAGDEHPDPLFDSTRDYLEQIEAYKRAQGKPLERRKRGTLTGGKASPSEKPSNATVSETAASEARGQHEQRPCSGGSPE